MTLQASPIDLDRDRLAGLALVMLAGTFWSTSGLFIRAMESADAWQVLFYRSLSVAGGAFIYLALRSRGRVLRPLTSGIRFSLLGGFFLAVASSSFIFALYSTTVANAVFMLAAGPFLTAILARVVLGEPIRRVTWITMLIAAAGILYMVGGAVGAGHWVGNLAAFVSVSAFACYSVTLRAGSASDAKRETLPVVVYGGLLTAIFGALMLDDYAVLPRDLVLCLAMGVVQVVLGMVFFLKGASKVSAAELALLSLTEVVLNPLWVWAVFAEVPEGSTLIGGAMIMSAVMIRAFSGLRRRPTWRSL
jgi:drug/metabolite transporter (DMT)-like permease